MKKTLLAAILFAATSITYAACSPPSTTGNAIRVTKRLADNSAFISCDLLAPASSADGIFFFNGSTAVPDYLTLGTGLSISSGVLNAASQVNADWTAGSGVSQILNKPSTFAPSAHTHPASEISDSTTVGRTVMTATDAAAARAAIGAGTGSGSVTSITAGTGLSGGTITTTGTISLPNTGTASIYSGVTTDAQGRVTAGTNRSFSYTTRSLNTCFQPSATRDVLATYSVDISTTLSLTTGQQGTVYLEIYTNNSCTTGTQEVTRFVNGNTGTLSLGLSMTQNVTGTLTGVIPAGSYVQLRTQNNTGTPSFTARPGQETLL